MTLAEEARCPAPDRGERDGLADDAALIGEAISLIDGMDSDARPAYGDIIAALNRAALRTSTEGPTRVDPSEALDAAWEALPDCTCRPGMDGSGVHHEPGCPADDPKVRAAVKAIKQYRRAALTRDKSSTEGGAALCPNCDSPSRGLRYHDPDSDDERECAHNWHNVASTEGPTRVDLSGRGRKGVTASDQEVDPERKEADGDGSQGTTSEGDGRMVAERPERVEEGAAGMRARDLGARGSSRADERGAAAMLEVPEGSAALTRDESSTEGGNEDCPDREGV